MSEVQESFPTASGKFWFTRNWFIDLGLQEYQHRTEFNALVVWRPGFTLWTLVYEYPKDRTREEFVLETINRKDLPEGARLVEDMEDHGFGYYFLESNEGRERWSLQTFTFGPDSHVVMAIYFDDESDLEEAKDIWRTLQHV